jgi:chemotaxis response regulator CheB
MAVDAMKLGAVDFLTKPLNYQNLQALIEDALARKVRLFSRGIRAREDPRDLPRPRSPPASPREALAAPALPDVGHPRAGALRGGSDAMKEVYAQIRSVADPTPPSSSPERAAPERSWPPARFTT